MRERSLDMKTKESLQRLLSLPTLSWRAKALACIIILHADIFADGKNKGKIARLVELGMEAEAAVTNGITELKHKGILEVKTIRNSEPGGLGYVIGNEWKIVVPD